jgi:hypothetical protein
MRKELTFAEIAPMSSFNASQVQRKAATHYAHAKYRLIFLGVCIERQTPFRTRRNAAAFMSACGAISFSTIPCSSAEAATIVQLR